VIPDKFHVNQAISYCQPIISSCRHQSLVVSAMKRDTNVQSYRGDWTRCTATVW